jgi:hypothetical protein
MGARQEEPWKVVSDGTRIAHETRSRRCRQDPGSRHGQEVRILSSKEKPEGRSLAIMYRGYWFYIEETDQNTKEYFSIMSTLWSTIIAGSAPESAAPVLTIPVSR